MSTKFLSPGWRMPRNANQSKSTNYSLDFNGSSHIDCGNDSSLSPSSFTFSVWSKSNLSDGAWIGKYSSENYGFGIYSGSIYLNIKTSAGWGGLSVTASSYLTSNNWHHIVGTYDGTNLKIYVDGNLADTLAKAGPITYTSRNTIIGALEGTSALDFTGQIDGVSIFDYALSEGQVTTLWGGGTEVSNPMALPIPPKAYYPLGESAGGFVGGTGTWLTENNAIGDYVFDFTSNANVNTNYKTPSGTEATVSGWFNIDSWRNYGGMLIDSTGAGVDTRLAIGQSGSGVTGGIYVQIGNGSTSWSDNGSVTFASKGVSFGKWFHLVATVNSTTVKVYINGDLAHTYTSTIAYQGAGTIPYYIGSWENSLYMDGKASNCLFFTKELTLTEVETLYNYGSPIQTLANIPQSSNLKAWYKLDATEIYNVTSTEWEVDNASSPFTSSLNFNGGSDYINCGSASYLNGLSNFTFSSWVNISSFTSGYDVIAGDWSYSATASLNKGHFIAAIGVSNGSAAKIRIYIKNAGADPGSSIITTDDYILNTGKWYHVLFTYNSGTVAVYINGVPYAVTSYGTIPTSFTSENSDFIIGKWQNVGGRFFPGSISNVQTFNTALPAIGSNSVETVYNSGNPLTDMSSFSSLVSWWKLDNTTTGIEDSKGSNNGTNNGATEAPGSVSTLNGQSTGMSQTNLVQSDLQTGASYSKYAMSFDGSDDYLIADNLNNTFASATNMTVSAWINPSHTSTSDYYYSIVNQWKWSSNPSWGLWLHSNGSTNSALHWNQENSAGAVEDTVKRIATNTWSHVAVVKEGTSLKMYYNGSLVHTGTVGLTTGNSVNRLTIGAQNLGANAFFNGSISNVSIWNATLISSQVREIYNEGLPSDLHNFSGAAPVAWWQLGENSSFTGDWICAEEIGSSNVDSGGMGVDALTNGVGTTANGTSTGMSEGSLVGDAPYSTANAISSGMPVTARVSGVSDATITTGGTGYAENFHGINIATTGGSGANCTINITTVSGGVITAITINNGGSNYVIGDVLTVSGGNSNATITVSGLNTP